MKNELDAKVAVVTRTIYRPVFISRLIESICAQTFNDFIWVIVDDEGGVKDQRLGLFKNVLEQLAKNGVNAKLIINEQNQGRSKSANIGIRSVDVEYVVLHDDDDSWDPLFLERAVSFLDDNPDYAGVVTHMRRIDEKIFGSQVKIVSSKVYNDNLRNITIAKMAHGNLFSPISFLFRKDFFMRVDGFDSSLTVLEDYDFCMRLLLEGNIGVIPEVLANHHYRWENHKEKKYNNTVTVGVDEHYKVYAEYVNGKLREDIAEQKVALGFILAIGEMLKGVNQLTAWIEKVKSWRKNILKQIRKMFYLK